MTLARIERLVTVLLAYLIDLHEPDPGFNENRSEYHDKSRTTSQMDC
jgi:hypothetical protein